MSDALAELRASLARSFLGPPPSALAHTDADVMSRALARVMQDHGGAGIEAKPHTILATVAAFRKTGRIGKFRDLKYVCLGVGSMDEDGWCVLGDGELRAQVAKQAEGQAESHRRFRCFQALLSSYWTFPIGDKAASEEALEGWKALRTWLRAERDRLNALDAPKPPWFAALLRHPQLLTHQPCDKFGAELLRGDPAGFNDARHGLAIPESSWVVEEAVIAQMNAACGLRDTFFKATMPDLLPIVMGKLNVRIGEAVRKRCVALLVSRYARCSDHPEDTDLRDCAVATIGNPWLRRTEWDAWVRAGKEPDDEARDMVFGWLKGRLVADFFELLSVDGVNDARRLAYWLRFVPFIDDMWFALGASARTRTGSKFAEFKVRAKGRLLNLEGTASDNNAFVMRIGSFLAVEFGATGNAFNLFRMASLPDSLRETLHSGKARASVGISELRTAVKDDKMRHVDSRVGLKSWEQKFDDRIVPLIGRLPEQRPACVPELEAILGKDVEVKDLRDNYGSLWIYETDLGSRLSRQLGAMGFSHRGGRGWFKE